MKTQLQKTGYAVLVAAVSAAFVLAAASSSEAAKKKKAAAKPPAPIQVICLNAGGPVCASKGGQKFTYANSCYAEKDGAKVSSSKACSGGKGKKMSMAKGKKSSKKKKM